MFKSLKKKFILTSASKNNILFWTTILIVINYKLAQLQLKKWQKFQIMNRDNSAKSWIRLKLRGAFLSFIPCNFCLYDI